MYFFHYWNIIHTTVEPELPFKHALFSNTNCTVFWQFHMPCVAVGLIFRRVNEWINYILNGRNVGEGGGV